MEDLDRKLMELIVSLPQEAKIQLLQALGQMQAPSVQEQALGQAFGGY